MRLLLDTHVFLWLDSDPARLPVRVKEMLLAPGCRPQLSMASAWEMAIKAGLGKLELTVPLDQMLEAYCRERGLELLPITLGHLVRTMELPHHHRDPFDRLIIAQALVESIPVVSADRTFAAYGVECRWD